MGVGVGVKVGASLAVLALAAPAAAQEAAPAQLAVTAGGVSANGGTVVYTGPYFARFEPNSAEDMLRRIPGVPPLLDAPVDQLKRGFGSAGSQILLNGRRFPGKANEITATLRRIAAGNVERVELITGASGEINVQSQGMVVNLVLRPGVSVAGSGNWELNTRFSEGGRPDIDGLIAYNGAVGALSYSLGLDRSLWAPPSRDPRWSYRRRDEVFFYPNGQVQEARPQRWRRTNDKWGLTGGLTYDFQGGDRLSLNGFYEIRDTLETTLTSVTRFSRQGVETLRGLELQTREVPNNHTLEIGGEYVSGVGPGDFTGLFIVRREDTPTLDFRALGAAGRVVQLSRSDADVDTGEDIVRGAYVVPLGAGRSLELGAEGARNTLSQQLISFRDFDADGVLDVVQVPGDLSDPQVKELRGETFAVFKWQATPALSLDSSLNYEVSRLTTNYPGYPARKLGFLKPRIDARYKFTPRDQLRLLVERTVSQLNFQNFVPKYNIDDQRIESGNPALEPEKAWRFEAGYERRLAKDGGVLELRGFYEHITDAIDRFPFCRVAGRLEAAETCFAVASPVGARLDSAFGNIDRAKMYGLEAKASLRLGFVGMPDAVLSLRGLRRWSDIQDPFTGRSRRLWVDRRHEYDVQFRHDLAAWRMAYGFTYKSTGVDQIDSDLSVTNHLEIEPLLEAFVERRISSAVTLRAELQNLTHSYQKRSRYLWEVAAADGEIERTLGRVDYFRERRDIRGALRLRGRF
jgi:hypothetical protein